MSTGFDGFVRIENVLFYMEFFFQNLDHAFNYKLFFRSLVAKTFQIL